MYTLPNLNEFSFHILFTLYNIKMFNKVMFFIYYFINPLRSPGADDDNRVLSREDLVRIHGEDFQDE